MIVCFFLSCYSILLVTDCLHRCRLSLLKSFRNRSVLVLVCESELVSSPPRSSEGSRLHGEPIYVKLHYREGTDARRSF
jgi:hypothetical protein